MSICQKSRTLLLYQIIKRAKGDKKQKEHTHTQPGNKTNPNLGYDYLKKGLINERKGTDYVKGGNMQTTIADFI